MKENSQHLWKMKLTMVGHAMPLIRIFLILRKFRVEAEALQIKEITPGHWAGDFVLDYRLSTRTDTVFRKIARLYDVAKLSYGQGKNPKKLITLK